MGHPSEHDPTRRQTFIAIAALTVPMILVIAIALIDEMALDSWTGGVLLAALALVALAMLIKSFARRDR